MRALYLHTCSFTCLDEVIKFASTYHAVKFCIVRVCVCVTPSVSLSRELSQFNVTPKMTPERDFPQWESLYAAGKVENLPWYSKKLDDDLKSELEQRRISKGRFLDIGTGPATQAAALFSLGFDVTGTDISRSAISRARKILPDRIKLVEDDILNSHLGNKEFDYAFDRGCFHVLSPSDRPRYVAQIKRLLNDGGILFLKTFSKKETRKEGPYKFSPDEIRQIFGGDFVLESVKETVYQGTLNPLPRALFVVLTKVGRKEEGGSSL
jgi:SAM-dependent methyltransferase